MPPRRRYDDALFEGFDAPPAPERRPGRRSYDDSLFEGFEPAAEAEGPDWIATGLRVVPGVIGGAVSTFTGGTGAGIGALAGGAGEAAAQAYERATGQRESFNPGGGARTGPSMMTGRGRHLRSPA